MTLIRHNDRPYIGWLWSPKICSIAEMMDPLIIKSIWKVSFFLSHTVCNWLQKPGETLLSSWLSSMMKIQGFSFDKVMAKESTSTMDLQFGINSGLYVWIRASSQAVAVASPERSWMTKENTGWEQFSNTLAIKVVFPTLLPPRTLTSWEQWEEMTISKNAAML
mgnify:CR=1 FL=1